MDQSRNIKIGNATFEQWHPGMRKDIVEGCWDNNPMDKEKLSIQTPKGWEDLRDGDWIVTLEDTNYIVSDRMFQEILGALQNS